MYARKIIIIFLKPKVMTIQETLAPCSPSLPIQFYYKEEIPVYCQSICYVDFIKTCISFIKSTNLYVIINRHHKLEN